MMRTLLLVALLAVSGAPVTAAPTRDTLARDVGQAEDVRAIKTLQRSYAQYAHYGRWSQMAALFTDDALWIFDDQTIKGRAAIARHLLSEGGGRDGLAPGAVDAVMIETPLINLAADGRTAKGRWHALSFLGDGKGKASILGGIYENDYVKVAGKWRIATLHFYPQYSGPYEEGWLNWKRQDLPIVPYHFTPDTAGVPIPLPIGPAPKSRETLAGLQRRIVALNEEDKIRNLQSAYGYYVDRRMWDDVIDLFAEDGVIAVGKVHRRGKLTMRRLLEARMGRAGLSHGQLNDHPQFDTTVTIAPGGDEAYARGLELGMLGDADKGTARWEASTFVTRFVRQGGIWKIRELHYFPLFAADYRKGWGKDAGVAVPVPARISLLTGPIVPIRRAPMPLAELERRLAVSKAYDGVENVSSAYGDYLDDFQSPQFSALLAKDGFKVSAFAGYYIGRERVKQAGLIVWGKPPVTRAGISYHWRIQPVINVAADGRSATYHARLFQMRTSKEPAKPYAFYGAGFHSGKYHDQMVLEDGVWRFWNLSLDEPYMVSPDWKSGWSGAKDRPIDTSRPPSPLLAQYPPDIPIKALGKRMEHFRGGTGETIEWPGILPMWFDYRNPVSGRVPEHYTPVCVPCDVRPDLALAAHGYLAPPTGPER
jgi:ketosteroid isomerase-like protein